jgi:DNA-binding NarL/FixJ family response regulator
MSPSPGFVLDLLDRPALRPDPVAPPAAAARPLRLALRVNDSLRRRSLEPGLAPTDEADADILVLDLPTGERLPAEAAAFDGPLVVLSDDPAVIADSAFPGVLPRAASPAQILAAAGAVAEGLAVRIPVLAERATFAPPEGTPRPLLTPRELEILAQVGQGMSNKAIARRLLISTHTVKYHLEAIFTKLGVRSRAEAVSRGLRHGLLVV